MTKAKGLLAGLVGALSVLSLSLPGNAAQYRVDAQHQQLINAVTDTGVQFIVNPKEYCGEKGLSGAYSPSNPGLFIVCQDNGTPGGPEVAWTENDLDTIRHEAHHLIQDCLAFRRGDQTMRPFNETIISLYNFALEAGLTPEYIERIIENYTNRGASDHVILMEIEAFATAHGIEADDIAGGIQTACPAN